MEPAFNAFVAEVRRGTDGLTDLVTAPARRGLSASDGLAARLKDVWPYFPGAEVPYNDAMERWEYTTFDMKKPKSDAAEGLARLGAEGWEAVGMVSSWGVGWGWVHPIVLLKRPLQD